MFSRSENIFIKVLGVVLILGGLSACGGGSSTTSDAVDNDDVVAETCDDPLHDAFAFFSDNVEVALSADGCEVNVSTNGLPDHVSTYWVETHSLYEAPTELQAQRMTPGARLDDDWARDGAVTLPSKPELATNSTGTTLGAVGIAVSGGFIFNQNEAGNEPVSEGVAEGFDNSGAHIGPGQYHYHLEPKAITNDDDALLGVIADGFFIYGRKDWATGGQVATGLDESGGHTHETQYSNGVEEYHYHIQEADVAHGSFYIFTGDYQGTPSNIQ